MTVNKYSLPADVAHDGRAVLLPVVFLAAQGSHAHCPTHFALDLGMDVLEVVPHPEAVDELAAAVRTNVAGLLLHPVRVFLLVVPANI